MKSKSKKAPAAPKPPAIYQDQLPAVPGAEIGLAATFPGETRTSGDAKVDHYATSIVRGWRETVESILQIGKTCAEAFASLDHLQRQKLYEKLPFGEATFSKLITIGKSETLLDVEVQEHLPPSWSIMYQLTNLTREEARKAIAEEALTPETTRTELNKWISKNSSSRKNRKGRRRKPIDNADQDALLRRLIEAFTGSPKLMAVWDECSRAVRKKFGRGLTRLI
jgi:hypothetical protein